MNFLEGIISEMVDFVVWTSPVYILVLLLFSVAALGILVWLVISIVIGVRKESKESGINKEVEMRIEERMKAIESRRRAG